MLKFLREKGTGSIVRGIASALSNIVTSTIHTGENIFEAIAHGVSSVTDSTTGVLQVAGTDIESILNIAGSGISGLILYAINVAIIVYLFRERCKANRVRILRSERQQKPFPVPRLEN